MYASKAGAFACRPFGAVPRTFKFVPDEFVEQGPHQSSLSTRHKKVPVWGLFMSGGGYSLQLNGLSDFHWFTEKIQGSFQPVH